MKKNIIDAINDWADSAEQTAKKARMVAKALTETAKKTEDVPVNQALDVAPKDAGDTHSDKKKDASEITEGMIRSVLAEKSQAGLTAKVKELLNSFGAAKLSVVKPEDYPALYEAAKALG